MNKYAEPILEHGMQIFLKMGIKNSKKSKSRTKIQKWRKPHEI